MQELPSYENTVGTKTAAVVPPATDTLGPATLYISGRFIYSTDPQAAPLYEFSHSIAHLRDTDRSVKVERVDSTLKTAQGLPQVTTRNRHLFDLKHPTAAVGPTFAYHAESVTRRTLCSFGASVFRAGGLLRTGKAYQFHRAVKGSDHKLEAQDLLFEASPSRDKAVEYEWKNEQESLIAREVKGEQADRSLVITAEMSVEMRDALVSAWVMRIWWELAKDKHTASSLMPV
ncbi:hypothetical protein FZEAL_2252 [Fusarium zealandicum]|uniref:Uncharacterized protein n=1 Tax=Fusarium zealandicum TaxID=1053134 RepID=A0A8H4UR73_9HYPO|nr:hypothetical protein FZEAL_2252 [Fusarium zealandicum]